MKHHKYIKQTEMKTIVSLCRHFRGVSVEINHSKIQKKGKNGFWDKIMSKTVNQRNNKVINYH